MWVAAFTIALGPAPPARAQVPAKVFEGLGDFTCMWWARGPRDPRKTFCVQTSRFALAFDYTKLDLTHLTPRARRTDEAAALVAPDDAVFGKPDASLTCEIESAGRRYRAVAPKKIDFRDCHLVESGRWFQRRYLERLAWAPGAPKVEAGLEIAAWPDRVLFLLRLRPAEAIRDGAIRMTFRLDGIAGVRGRVGGEPPTFRLPVGDWPAGTERELPVVIYPASGQIESPTAPPRRRPAPLAVTARQTAPRQANLPVTYDEKLGWHYVALRNDVTDRTDAGRNRRIERVGLTLTNPSPHDRPVRLCFAKDRPFGITGLSAMLRDQRGQPTGIPIQVSKNWHTGRGPGRYHGPWYRGLTMLTLPAASTVRLEYTSVNALWGSVPAASHAQLCLTGWGSNQLWEQAALGSWGESLCFEPDQAQRGGAVLDTRPLMVHAMGKRPKRRWGWTHNVGGADFLVYYDRPGSKQAGVRMRTRHRRTGPVLTEVTTAGRSRDRKIDLRYTVSLYRTDDLLRGVYRFRYDVRRPVTFDRLVLFQCGGDDYSYTGERKFARGNAAGLVEEWATTWGGNRYRTKPVEVTGRTPWFSMHQAVRRENDQGAWANRGLVIREWSARLGGRPARPWAAERGARVRGKDTSLIDLLPPPNVDRLLPGDFVQAVVEHVVVPQFADDYYGPNARLAAALKTGQNTWQMIHREAIGNDLAIDVARGRLLRRRPTRIAADAGRAEFTITGGLGYAPITLAGLGDYRRPVLQLRQPGGDWKTIDQSDHGSDFWQADYDPATRTWDITYTIPLDTPDDRRTRHEFRFRLAGDASAETP